MRQWLRRPAPEPGAWLEWGRFLPGVQELQKTNRVGTLSRCREQLSPSSLVGLLPPGAAPQSPSAASLPRLDPINPGRNGVQIPSQALGPALGAPAEPSPAVPVSLQYLPWLREGSKGRGTAPHPGNTKPNSLPQLLRAQAGSPKDPQHPCSGFQRG